MPAVITKGTIEDAEVLSTLGAKTFYETFASHNTAEDMLQHIQQHFTPATIQKEFSEKGVQFFLARLDEEVAGYAKLRRTQKPHELYGLKHIELERIYVLQSFQGNRIGLLLMNECIQYARRKKYEILWLGVWEHNQKAIAFYKKLGFTVFSEHEFVLGTDKQNDYLMKLVL
ncbi:GNAT family N-acetyltransferase [Foetidibacter luteolus]|uniref:GNAT family N-acetyltransferase n=1 Tax=Foetidibacter luteolus TaxID=2608880 RepID=UPI00129BE8C3|nr:GNAT family N-acetyltransferase [Foetidibacter luteolus]